jgi:PAS domain S-box-containing protein
LLAEAHLSAIVQYSDDAIISKSLDGLVVTWNPAASRIFGFSENEMVGQSIRRLIPADRQDEEDAILARIAQGQRVESFETIRQRKDGSTFRVSLTVSPILDPQGTVIGASKIARDVSARHAAQEALRESEHHFRMLADNISQQAWIADAQGRAIWLNRRWHDFTGQTPRKPCWTARCSTTPTMPNGWWPSIAPMSPPGSHGKTRFRCAGAMAATAGFWAAPPRSGAQTGTSSTGSAPIPT